jgi:hypothetical protein
MAEVAAFQGSIHGYGVEVEDSSDAAFDAARTQLTQAILAAGYKPEDYAFRRVRAWDADLNRIYLRVDAVQHA